MGVIESGLAQATNIRIAPLVIGVTALALARSRQRVEAMEPATVLDVVRNDFVTNETERSLSLSVEGLMARRAVLLEFCVACYERSGHDHSFPFDRDRRCSQRHQAGDSNRIRREMEVSASATNPLEDRAHGARLSRDARQQRGPLPKEKG